MSKESRSPLVLPTPSITLQEQESQSGPPGQRQESRPQRRCLLSEGVPVIWCQTEPETDQGLPAE